jgi:hypothetical protein
LRALTLGPDPVACCLQAHGPLRPLFRIESAVGGLDALSAPYLMEEIKQLREAHPSYLFFEYLA